MPLKARLTLDMQSALRAGDKLRLSILRMALAAVTQREVDTRHELDDAAIESLLERMIKQGRDSATQYGRGGRDELAAKEQAEIAVLQSYLPEPLSEPELLALIAEVIEQTGASSSKDMGKVMAAVRARAAGRVEMSEVSARVRTALRSN